MKRTFFYSIVEIFDAFSLNVYIPGFLTFIAFVLGFFLIIRKWVLK